jgi:hypothetical protein
MGVNEKSPEFPTAVDVPAAPSDGTDAGSSHEITINKTLDRAYGKLAFGEVCALGSSQD